VVFLLAAGSFLLVVVAAFGPCPLVVVFPRCLRVVAVVVFVLRVVAVAARRLPCLRVVADLRVAAVSFRRCRPPLRGAVVRVVVAKIRRRKFKVLGRAVVLAALPAAVSPAGRSVREVVVLVRVVVAPAADSKALGRAPVVRVVSPAPAVAVSSIRT
jgi:hypothetical protein